MGLFKRAIIQSGVAHLNSWSFTDIPDERKFLLGKALNFETNSTESLVREFFGQIKY